MPVTTSTRVYCRAPQEPTGGLHNQITKAVLINTPDTILRLGLPIVFLGLKHGQIPLKDVFDTWMDNQHNHTLFKAVCQLANKTHIGQEIATDALKQRFHNLAQRGCNPSSRKMDYLSVNEFHSEIMSLINELNDKNAAFIAAQVPELDTLFYHGLIQRLKARRELAALTQHALSTTLGENIQRLQTMVDAAKLAEQEINQVVTIATQNFRRNPIGGGTFQSEETLLLQLHGRSLLCLRRIQVLRYVHRKMLL